MVREVGFRATGQVYRSRWFDRTVEGPAFVSLRAHAAPLPEHYDSDSSTIFLRDFKLAGPAPSLKSSEDAPYSLRRRNSFPQNQFSSERSQNLPEVNWNVLNIDLIQHFLRQYGNRDAAIAGLEVLWNLNWENLIFQLDTVFPQSSNHRVQTLLASAGRGEDSGDKASVMQMDWE